MSDSIIKLHKAPSENEVLAATQAIVDTDLKPLTEAIDLEGVYPKESYKDFRSFLRKVARYDNQKVALIKGA